MYPFHKRTVFLERLLHEGNHKTDEGTEDGHYPDSHYDLWLFPTLRLKPEMERSYRKELLFAILLAQKLDKRTYDLDNKHTSNNRKREWLAENEPDNCKRRTKRQGAGIPQEYTRGPDIKVQKCDKPTKP